MKKTYIRFLQLVIVLIGLAALAALLVEPWFEGVNAHATSFVDVYFKDGFLALAYLGSLPFFYALYQACKVLSQIGKGHVFSHAVITGLRKITYCALTVVGFVVLEGVYIGLTHGDDDATGAVFVGGLIVFTSLVIATTSALFERLVHTAMQIKAENDLTV